MTFWVAGAAVVGGVASAAIGSKSASKAAASQQAGTNASIAAQMDQYNQTRDDLTPQRLTGYAALNELNKALGLNAYSSQPAETYEQIRARLTPQYRLSYGGDGSNGIDDIPLDAAAAAEFQRQKEQGYGSGGTATGAGQSAQDVSADVMADPGYQFGLQQGQLGLDRKAAASGGRVSGAALKAASEYATNYASTGYNAAYQRRQDRLNRLQQLAGLGTTSTTASAAAGSNAANAISIALSSQGNATAAGQLAQGNIWGNAINQGAAALSKYANSNTLDGFNGNALVGYTYQNPAAVGPVLP